MTEGPADFVKQNTGSSSSQDVSVLLDPLKMERKDELQSIQCDSTIIPSLNEFNDNTLHAQSNQLDAFKEEKDLDDEDDEDEEYNPDDEPIDPRIEEKLEELNQWTVRINNLEKEFDEANNQFRTYLTDYSDKLKLMARKIGPKAVNEARSYYEAKERAKLAQAQCQITVAAYEKACHMLSNAKQEIEATEKKFNCNNESKSKVNDSLSTSRSNAQLSPVPLVDSLRESPDFDVTWQEMLNQSTIKLMESEKLKKQSKENHERSMKEYIAAEEEVARLERKMKSTIKKTKGYFEESHKFKDHLVKIKAEIAIISEKIKASKSYYSLTLKDLEFISEEIHEKRNLKLVKSLKKREPGVGAEEEKCISSLHLEEGRFASPSSSSSSTSSSNLRHFDYSSIDIVPELNVNSPRFQIQIRPSSLAILNSSSNDLSSSSNTENDADHSICQVSDIKILSSTPNATSLKIYPNENSSFDSSFSSSSASSSFRFPHDSFDLTSLTTTTTTSANTSMSTSSTSTSQVASSKCQQHKSLGIPSSVVADGSLNSNFGRLLSLSGKEEEEGEGEVSGTSLKSDGETFDDVDLNA